MGVYSFHFHFSYGFFFVLLFSIAASRRKRRHNKHFFDDTTETDFFLPLRTVLTNFVRENDPPVPGKHKAHAKDREHKKKKIHGYKLTLIPLACDADRGGRGCKDLCLGGFGSCFRGAGKQGTNVTSKDQRVHLRRARLPHSKLDREEPAMHNNLRDVSFQFICFLLVGVGPTSAR